MDQQAFKTFTIDFTQEETESIITPQKARKLLNDVLFKAMLDSRIRDINYHIKKAINKGLNHTTIMEVVDMLLDNTIYDKQYAFAQYLAAYMQNLGYKVCVDTSNHNIKVDIYW